MQTEETEKDIQSRWDAMWQAVLKKYRETGKSSCSDDDIDLSQGHLLYKEFEEDKQ